MKAKHLPVLMACAGAVLLSGCANVTTGERYSGFDGVPEEVCVVVNPKVKISQVLPAIREGLERRGVRVQTVESAKACPCEYTVTYEARRSWDATTYLGSAFVVLNKGDRPIARADYKAGPMTFTKWGRTAERIDRMIGELLKTN